MTRTSHLTPVITYETAATMIAAAMAHAARNKWRVAAVVLDPGGAVVASGRMDGVSPTILDIATDKAFTACLGKSTQAFYDRMSSAPDLMLGLQTRPRLCTWEGGMPIREQNALIGAIGVSGAAGPEDVACALAALAEVGLET